MKKKCQSQNENKALRIQWHRMEQIIKRKKGKERKRNDWKYIAYKKRIAGWENLKQKTILES